MYYITKMYKITLRRQQNTSLRNPKMQKIPLPPPPTPKKKHEYFLVGEL